MIKFLQDVFLKGNKILPVDNQYFQNLKKISIDGQLFINIIIGVDNDLKVDPVIYCPTLSLDDNETKKFKDYLRKELLNLSKKIIDDNIFLMK